MAGRAADALEAPRLLAAGADPRLCDRESNVSVRSDLEVPPLSIRIPVSIRSLFVIVLTLLSLTASHVASAAGRTEWKSKVIKERREDQPNDNVVLPGSAGKIPKDKPSETWHANIFA